MTRQPEGPFRGPPWWLADLLLCAVVILMAFAPLPDPVLRPEGPLALALAFAPVVVVPARRRLPFLALVAAVALFAAAASSGMLLPGISLALFVTVFGIADRTDRRIGAITALSVIVAVVAISMLAGYVRDSDFHVVPSVLMIAFAAAAGDARRSHRDYLAAITERAERAEQTRESEARRRVSVERLRIARDLHDAVAHQISVISLNAGVASSALTERPDEAREALGAIRHASRTVLGEIGELLRFLRADDEETPIRPQPGLDRLDELIASFADSGLAVTARIEGELPTATGASGLVAYRVLQEGLTNALKHGAEHRAHVLLDARDARTLTVTVTNPIPPGPLDSAGAGHGLIGLRERVAAVRGVVEARTAPGGWRLTASLPLPKDHTA